MKQVHLFWRKAYGQNCPLRGWTIYLFNITYSLPLAKQMIKKNKKLVFRRKTLENYFTVQMIIDFLYHTKLQTAA